MLWPRQSSTQCLDWLPASALGYRCSLPIPLVQAAPLPPMRVVTMTPRKRRARPKGPQCQRLMKTPQTLGLAKTPQALELTKTRRLLTQLLIHSWLAEPQSRVNHPAQ